MGVEQPLAIRRGAFNEGQGVDGQLRGKTPGVWRIERGVEQEPSRGAFILGWDVKHIGMRVGVVSDQRAFTPKRLERRVGVYLIDRIDNLEKVTFGGGKRFEVAAEFARHARASQPEAELNHAAVARG